MDNMKEMRNKVQDGKYNLTLEVAEGAYFGTYDANFNDIKIKYNKNRHTVRVTAELNYDNNVHSDYHNRGKLM